MGHTAWPQGGVELAATLALGGQTYVSHRSAASLWRLFTRRSDPRPVDLTVVGRDPHRRHGICIHRVASLEATDVDVLDEIPILTPARTLLDLAAQVGPAPLEFAVAQARILGLVTDEQLHEQVVRNRGRRGVRRLRHLLERELGPALTRSEAERRFLRTVRSADLPEPGANVDVNGVTVDFLWSQERLIVEVDGFAFHSDRAQFERDRLRDAELAAQGYSVIRVTWRQLVDQPEAVLARLRRALRRRRDGAFPRQP